jgi:hypothetical protein
MRALKALVIVMGILIVVGLGVIGVTIFHRMSKPATPPPAPVATPVPAAVPAPSPAAAAAPATAPGGSALNVPIGAPLPTQFDRKFGDVSVDIPPGAHVADFSASGDRLVLRVIMPDQQQRLLVVDLLTGNLLGTIKLASGGATPTGGSQGGNPGILPPLPSVNVPPRNKSEGLK